MKQATTPPGAAGRAGGARTLVVEVELPDRELCGNGTAHAYSRSQLVAAQRAAAALAAYTALAALPGTLRGPLFPRGTRVTIAMAVRRPSFWARRRLDDDNLIRGCKGIADGFTDAAVWDDDRQARWGAIAWEAAKPGEHGITMTLTEVIA